MRPRQLPRVLRVVGLDLAASLEQRRSAVLEVQTCFAAVAQRRSASEHCTAVLACSAAPIRLPALRAHCQMCRRPCGRLGHDLHDGAAARGGRVVKTKLLRNRSPDLYLASASPPSGGRPRLVADHTHKEPCTKTAGRGPVPFYPSPSRGVRFIYLLASGGACGGPLGPPPQTPFTPELCPTT